MMSANESLQFVFIHGAGGTKSKWRTLTFFLEDHKSIYIDLPGHGENEGEMCQSIQEYAQSVSQSIAEDSIVVGHSMGGLIAIELAAINKHVKGIILAASSYKLPVHPKIIESLAQGVFPDKVFRASYAKNVDPYLLEEEAKERDELPKKVAMKDFQACDEYKIGKATVENLKQPILAVIGDEDRLVPPETDKKLQKLNPNIQVGTIEDAGHYAVLEKPESFLEYIVQFKEFVTEV